jgi:hypothetical protein
MTDTNKHSSLLRHTLNYVRKKFYSKGPCVNIVIFFVALSK